MAKLTITGERKYLELIQRENRLRSAKYNLKFSFEEPKAKEEPLEDVKDIEVIPDPETKTGANPTPKAQTPETPKSKSKAKKG
jgi:hypothetical protein